MREHVFIEDDEVHPGGNGSARAPHVEMGEDLAWSRPVALDARELPEFPLEALPDVLQDWAKAEAHATQTPVDLAANMGIGVCSAAVARKARIVLHSHSEPLNLFLATALESGNRKSAVSEDAGAPIRDHERELGRMAERSIAEATSSIAMTDRIGSLIR